MMAKKTRQQPLEKTGAQPTGPHLPTPDASPGEDLASPQTIVPLLLAAVAATKNRAAVAVPIGQVKVSGPKLRHQIDESQLTPIREAFRDDPTTVEPLIVVAQGDDYIVIDGRRRLRAANLENQKRIRIVQISAAADQFAAIALRLNSRQSEALKRTEIFDAALTAICAWAALRKAVINQTLTVERVGLMLGVSRSTISRIAEQLRKEEADRRNAANKAASRPATRSAKSATQGTPGAATKPDGPAPQSSTPTADDSPRSPEDAQTSAANTPAEPDLASSQLSVETKLGLAREFLRLAKELAALWNIEPAAVYDRAAREVTDQS